MRQFIDAVKRLNEADVISFPQRPRGEPGTVGEPSEVVPFPTQKRAEAVARDRQRYRLLVVAAASRGPGERPEMKVVDVLDHLNASEVAGQLSNYHPVERNNNTWISAPTGNTRFYMRVMVGKEPPSEPELEAIAQQMAGDQGSSLGA